MTPSLELRSHVLEDEEGAGRTLLVCGDTSRPGHFVVTVSPAHGEETALARTRHVFREGWGAFAAPAETEPPRAGDTFVYDSFRVLRDNIEVIVARARMPADVDEEAPVFQRTEAACQLLGRLP